MGISLFRRLSEAHPQAISMLQNQVSLGMGVVIGYIPFLLYQDNF